MTQANGQTYTPVIFLDTNAVHVAKLALSFGTAKGIDVLGTQWDNVQGELKKCNVGPGALDSYKSGYWILNYLSKRGPEPVEFYFSPITRLELLCGSLRGEAIKNAVKSGVPNRWFSRLEEKDIRVHLEPDGYAQVQSEHLDIQQQLDSKGIALNEQTLDHDVWQIARTLLENIFVDVQDCLVLASAILRQASEILTVDGYLFQLAGWMKNPGSATPELRPRFGTVQSTVIDACVRVCGWDKSQVLLPDPRSIRMIEQYLAGGGS